MNPKTIDISVKNIILLVILFTLLHSNKSLLAATPKHIAVPAEEMQNQKLPDKKNTGVFSHSSMLPIVLPSGSASGLTSNIASQQLEQFIYLDEQKNTPLIFISPYSDDWLMTITDPNGRLMHDDLDSASAKLPVTEIKIGQDSFKGKQFVMQNPTVGAWKVTLIPVNKYHSQIKMQKDQPIGYLMFKGDTNYQLYSYIDEKVTTQIKSIRLIAYAIDSSMLNSKRQAMLNQSALSGAINSASVSIVTPSNKRTTLTMFDDGTHGDEFAGDGLFSQLIPTAEVGVYTSEIQITGIRSDGVKFSRTINDLYSIAAVSWEFTNSPAELTMLHGNRAQVSIPFARTVNSPEVFLGAELWGTNINGVAEPAAWIGGIASITQTQNERSLSLSTDIRWLARKNLQAPFSLRAVRLQTAANNVPIAEKEYIPIQRNDELHNRFARVLREEKNLFQQSSSTNFTEEMLMGNAPSIDKNYTSNLSTKLLLVHGYCSGSVWNTAQFSNSAEFQDYAKNRSHDAFAQQIMSFGADYSSYGIVAHSQGGAAALQIYAKYWSGLDSASGGRLIQSVGTPYQGTALAGNAAVLGQIFGVGCGQNTDLTYSGAANWLATIPSWARAEVDYYTTSFKTRWWAYDYCHLVTDLLLNDPEDGTTEKWAGQLSGAVNKGHKTGLCHTTGMRDTAQYKDSSRNASMSSRAAR